MNGRLREAYDDDREAYDDSSEGLLGDIAGVASGVLGPIVGGVGSAVSNVGTGLFGGPQRTPLAPPSAPPQVAGVGTGVINTPRGTATFQLPDKVVTTDEFKQTVDQLHDAIERNTVRTNTTQSDIQGLRSQVGQVTVRIGTEVTRLERDQRTAIAKLRKDQSSQAMTNLMLTFIMQQQSQSNFLSHVHLGVTTGTGSSGVPKVSGGGNSFMMLLPFMMMGQDGGSGDNSMMMMMMVLALSGGLTGGGK